MSYSLNNTRIRDSWLVGIAAAILYVFSDNLFPIHSLPYLLLSYAGYFMVAICALGRVYCTAFLGGNKNTNLITYGPFSIVRNPLYLLSLTGATGIALITMKLPIMILAPLAILVIYHFLIRREEEFLSQHFGDEYEEYKKSTPRLIPRFSQYQAPETVPMDTKKLLHSLRDAVWWFVPFPLMGLVGHFM